MAPLIAEMPKSLGGSNENLTKSPTTVAAADDEQGLEPVEEHCSELEDERSLGNFGELEPVGEHYSDLEDERSLGNFGASEEEYEREPRQNVKRTLSSELKRAVETLNYSQEDLDLLACDSTQFEVLKQSLRKKGAITNEVLRQKLPLFLKYKRDRMTSAKDAPPRFPRRSRSTSSASGVLAQMSKVERQSSLKPANRLLSEEELQAGEPQQGLVGRIMRPNASKLTLSGPSLTGRVPQRTRSTGRSVPNRTSSLTRLANKLRGWDTPEDAIVMEDGTIVYRAPKMEEEVEKETNTRSVPIRTSSFARFARLRGVSAQEVTTVEGEDIATDDATATDELSAVTDDEALQSGLSKDGNEE